MRTVLRNATVIDGTGAAPASGDVSIEDGLIVDVGPGLDGDDEVDLEGSWLLPGIVDCHVHVVVSSINFMRILSDPFSLPFYFAAQNLELTLKSGVTSVRDAAGADLGIKRAVEMGLINGPRMKIAITMISQTGGHGDVSFIARAFGPHPGRPSGVCNGPDDTLRTVREVIRAGADVIKIATTGGALAEGVEATSSHFLPEEIETIVREAAASGLRVMSHAQGVTGIANALRGGVRSIEHGILLNDETIELFLETGAFLVPTPLALQSVANAPEGIPDSTVRKTRELVEVHRDSIKRAADTGVKIAMGTDAGIMAHGRNLEELILMAEVGLSPLEVVRSATQVAAQNLGVGDQRGTIEPGKDADLITLDSDPIADVRVFADPENVTNVWLGGRRVKQPDGHRSTM